MSAKNRSCRAGKYGEDHVGKMKNPTRSSRGFSSTLRPSGVGGTRGLAVPHPNNNYSRNATTTPAEASNTEPLVLPPIVLPDDSSDWEDDVSALTNFSSGFHVERNTKSFSSKPFDALQQVAEGDLSTAEQNFSNRQGMYPELKPSPVYSRLTSLALKNYAQRYGTEAEDYDIEAEADAFRELYKLSKELNLDDTQPQNYQKDQDTGTTEEDDSETIRTPESYYRKKQEVQSAATTDPSEPKTRTKKKKKDPSKSSSSDKERKNKSKKSSKRRNEKPQTDSETQQQAVSSSIRSNLPSDLDDETLEQLTSVVLEAVSIITSSSKDDKSTGSHSSFMQHSSDQADVGKKEQRPPRQKKSKKRKPKKVPSNPSVMFSTVEVRQYERILSDNPSCSNGPSVGIGWQYDEEDTIKISIDEFEDHRLESRLPSVPVLNRFDREELLRELGYSRQDLAVAVRNANKIRNKRRQTVTNLYTQKAEETAETAARFIKKRFSFGRGEDLKF